MGGRTARYLVFLALATGGFLVTRKLTEVAEPAPGSSPAPPAGTRVPPPRTAQPIHDVRAIGRWAARRRQVGADPPTVQLSELEYRALDDARANNLRILLVKAIGERVFASPDCYPAREPGSRLRVQLHVVSTASDVTFTARTLTVAQGAPLPTETLRCIESRLSAPVRIDRRGSADSAEISPLEFEGESAVELNIGRSLT